VNPDHDDYPALLAEALDTVVAFDFDLPAAAGALNCTASQLLKLIKEEPAAIAYVNDGRARKGLHPLR
jgi:hypothetical protein